MLESALCYIARGWRVHPCRPRGKTPLTVHGVKDATTDEAQIREWWAKWPDANIGIATGKKSGFFVLDVDGDSGAESLRELDKEIGGLPEALRSRTGTDGEHIFFRYPEREIGNKQSFRPGLDIRGEGGYVIAPPSIHPNGQPYTWPLGKDTPLPEPLDDLLDIIQPKERTVSTPPWRRMRKDVKRVADAHGTSVTERASKYLQECEAAVQGSGGHDALLWACRALVVGFEMRTDDAISLLWNEYNPRCSPPWDRSKPSDVKDFERKVLQALETPGKKHSGWLLDECGLRQGSDKLAAMGKQFAKNLIDSIEDKSEVVVVSTPDEPEEKPKQPKYAPFPIECLPTKVRVYCEQGSAAHDVDPSLFSAFSLQVASSAMGNAFRLRLKNGFDVPPTLWMAVVSPSGSNKSGPLDAITAPLRRTPPLAKVENPLLNPQGRLIVSDATTEALIGRLEGSPRGMCLSRDEIAAWLKSFNVYKKGGGDIQTWIEFWGAKSYQLDRKTDREEVFIPAAAVSVIGGIQPEILAECFEPDHFNAGMVQRILVLNPPDKDMFWTDEEITVESQKEWLDAITWLRTRPFASLDAATGQYMPNIVVLDPMAKERYVAGYNAISRSMKSMTPMQRTFASKTRVSIARIALCNHGLYHAVQHKDVLKPISLKTMEDSVKIGIWFQNEQLRVYGIAQQQHQSAVVEEIIVVVKSRLKGSATVRQLQQSNGKKYNKSQKARDALNLVVAAGRGSWDDKHKVMTINDKESKP